MASTRELRRRIRSTKNIGQITKAMQMVAATKMRRAQTQALNGRPYTGALNESLLRLLPATTPEDSPLLSEGKGGTGAILLSTDKSLCGALNTNLFRATQNFVKDKGKVEFYTVGSKGRGFVVKSGKDLKADVENKERISFKDATTVAKLVSSAFLDKEIKECFLIYPHFISTLRQEPIITKILPIDASELEAKGPGPAQEFLFEPDSKELLDYVLTHYVESKIFQALLETKASEHSARMMAMQNATDNAKDLVDDLTLSYNQIRQDSITKELLEITTAGAALE